MLDVSPDVFVDRFGSDLQVTRERVNAETALEWLTANIQNRSMQNGWVAQLADEMTGGHWRFNGEPIIFDADGHLLDGQHRLQAVFESDSEIDFLVVRGVDRSSFPTIDTGRVRTGGDVLSIDGHTHSRTLASAIAWLWRMEHDEMRSRSRVSNSVVLDYARKHPEVLSSLDFVHSIGVPARLVAAGIAVAMHVIFARINREDADVFVASLLRGTDLAVDSPILKLRERFVAASNPASPKSQKMRPYERLALSVKVWNAVRSGKNIRVLVFRQHGKSVEKFPTPM